MDEALFSRPYPYALDRLELINRARVDGVPVAGIELNDTAIWQTYQTQLFIEIVAYAQRRMTPSPESKGSRGRGITSKVLAVLISLYALTTLLIRRPRVLLYSIDKVQKTGRACDFRMEAIYRFLEEEHISYRECFHTVFDERFLSNIARRKRAGIYLEAFDVLYRACTLFKNPPPPVSLDTDSAIDKDEQVFLEGLVQRYYECVWYSRFRIAVLSFFLRLSGCKALFAIDDPRYYHDVVAACARAGIPTFAFQHGQFTEYEVGSRRMVPGNPAMPDKLFVWSEYWKKELSHINTYLPTDQIAVGGISVFTDQTFERAAASSPLGILIPYESGSSQLEMKSYVEELLQLPDTVIYFKIRSDVPQDAQCAAYGITPGERVVCVRDFSEARGRVHVMLGMYSTVLYDAVALRIPVAIAKNESNFGEGMVRNALAVLVEPGQVRNELEAAGRTSAAELEKRFTTLYGSLQVRISDTLSRLADELGI